MRLFLILGLATCSLFASLEIVGGTQRPLLDGSQDYTAPFLEGEQLRYEVRWKPPFLPSLKAGEIQLDLHDSELKGTQTYKIVALASSAGGLAKIAGIQVRDYFESNVDRGDFRSYQMISKTRRGRRQRDLVLTFDYAANQTLVLETDPAHNPPREIRRESFKGIPGPAIDILSVFYVARLHPVEVGDRFLFQLNERGRFKPVTIVAERRERVRTPVGTFEAIRLSTVGGFLGEQKDFRVWYSSDRFRLPVRFEADARFGNVSGQLIRVQTPRMIRAVIPVPDP